MHSEDFEFDLSIDDILTQFTEEPEAPVAVSSAEPEPLQEEAEPPVSVLEQPDFSADDTAIFSTAPSGEQEDKITHFADKYKRQPALEKEKKPSHFSRAEKEDSAPVEARKSFGKSAEERLEKKAEKRAEKEARREKKEALREEKRAEKTAKRLAKSQRDTFADLMPRWLIRFVGFILTAVLLLFVLCRVAPASGSAAATKPPQKTTDIAASVNRYASEKAYEAALLASAHAEEIAAQQALEEAAKKTVYRIPEEATVAPEPLLSGFGKVNTADAAEIMAIVQQARDSGLLGPEERIVFDPNVEFNTGSYYQDIQYYLDDTLLVICWKEIIDGNTCTFCEVKMQDGSQIRRKLAGDMFGSDVLEYTTSMHKATNAVVSVNADYYRFRDMGIVAYNRQLYRFNESLYLNRYGQDLKKYNCVDTLFVTASGDFLFFHQYEETTPEAVQQFITDNNVIFSVAFGPVLVENGMLNASRDFEEEWYPIGEVNTGYSRAGIGQVDKLHYLYMSLNHSDEKQARWHVKEFAQHFYEKGVISAYNLDGGQTGEIVFQGNEAYNHVDHVNGTSSRQVSDMIYFASAINGEEVTQ